RELLAETNGLNTTSELLIFLEEVSSFLCRVSRSRPPRNRKPENVTSLTLFSSKRSPTPSLDLRRTGNSPVLTIFLIPGTPGSWPQYAIPAATPPAAWLDP